MGEKKAMVRPKRTESILFFCAHNDDQIIGAGGTIAQYAMEGKEIYVYIFSYGEGSHPHLKRKVIIRERVMESKKSDKILGVKETVYFGIKEGRFASELSKGKMVSKIKKIIEYHMPSKIFTHSLDDPHPDHRAVYHSISSISRRIGFKGDLYSFEIWNVLNFRKTNCPKLVVDITDTFHKKVKAFRVHESQKFTIITLMWNIRLKALLNGFNNRVKYAEVFQRII